jgi:hypothetical protein
MKRIAAALWNEPVVVALIVNGVIAALAAEGLIAGWISVVVLAATAPILRHFTIPEKKLSRALDQIDRYEGSN